MNLISPSYYTLAILLMACITFFMRYVFFTRLIEFELSPIIKSLLTFTAPCVLSALCVPIVFKDILGDYGNQHGLPLSEQLMLLMHSSYFWAGCVAVLLSLVMRHMLLVICLSMVAFYAFKFYVFV